MLRVGESCLLSKLKNEKVIGDLFRVSKILNFNFVRESWNLFLILRFVFIISYY